MMEEEKSYKINKVEKYDEKISKEKKSIIINTVGIGALAIVAVLSGDMSNIENFALSSLPLAIMSVPMFVGLVGSLRMKTIYENEKENLENESKGRGR